MSVRPCGPRTLASEGIAASIDLTAAVAGGQRVKVTLTLDEAPRTVEAPAELKCRLKAAGLLPIWKALSVTHQREHVEAITQAKKPESRERRIAASIEELHRRAASAKAKAPAKHISAAGR